MLRRNARPTDGELEILNVLWQHGPCAVKDVFEAISHKRPTGYTTTLKLMQIMVEKGLVKRDERQRAHIYEARFQQQQMQQRLVRDLLKRAFNGSAVKLAMQALANQKASRAELAQIRALLNEMERGKR